MIIIMIFFIITLEPWACPFRKSLYGTVSPHLILGDSLVVSTSLGRPSWEEVIKKAAAAPAVPPGALKPFPQSALVISQGP